MFHTGQGNVAKIDLLHDPRRCRAWFQAVTATGTDLDGVHVHPLGQLFESNQGTFVTGMAGLTADQAFAVGKGGRAGC